MHASGDKNRLWEDACDDEEEEGGGMTLLPTGPSSMELVFAMIDDVSWTQVADGKSIPTGRGLSPLFNVGAVL